MRTVAVLGHSTPSCRALGRASTSCLDGRVKLGRDARTKNSGADRTDIAPPTKRPLIRLRPEEEQT
jgi:hypothetical protein